MSYKSVRSFLSCKNILTFGLGGILSLSISNFSYEARADDIKPYPLVSMTFLLVPEIQACKDYGYDDPLGCKSPLYYVDDIKPLIDDDRLLRKTISKIPAGETVYLPNEFSLPLSEYSKNLLANGDQGAGGRMSMIMLFDFGQDQRNTDLDFQLSWNQPTTEKLCRSYNFPPVPSGSSRTYTIPSNYQYLIFHRRAEVYDPCANVVWTLKVTDKSTGVSYKPWTFRTTSRKDN